VEFRQKSWNLTDVLPSHSGPEFHVKTEELKRDLEEFGHLKEGLSPKISPRDLRSAIESYEKILEQNARFKWFAYMYFSQDTTSQEARAFKSNMDELDATVQNETVFFNLWLTKLDEKTANRLNANLHRDFAYYIEKLRKKKCHLLEEPVERIITTKNTTGRVALVQLYQQITNAFEYTMKADGRSLKDEKGKPRRFGYSELVSFIFGSDSKLREAAYKALYREYMPHKDVLGEIYKTLVRDWRNEFINTRQYTSPISVFNLLNDVPDEAVDTLLMTCRRNADVFQRFFVVKARLLKIKELNRYHIYAPLEESDRTIPYTSAVQSVLAAYDSFHPKLGELARRVFQQDHVDSEIRKGKYSGAYCMTVTPKIVPYILINYAGSFRHVTSIAHEVGHALHTMLASSHSLLTFHAPTPLAEIASLFGELILLEKLMKEEEAPQIRQELLLSALNKLYGTIPRQAYFSIFEKAAHSAVDDGATVDELAELYFSGLEEQFGDAVRVPNEFAWEWITIPHIYRVPFYCWTYSFGNLVTLGLFNRFKEEGESFKSRYIKLLSYGGSESPEKILSEVGVDIRSKKFWQSGFDIIDGMITDLSKATGLD